MAMPRSREARLFYRCALQRYEESEILLKADKPTGAVYLAGYGIECMLKALILSSIPAGEVGQVLGSFRTHRAHEYEWLRAQYRTRGRGVFPGEIMKYFARVDLWSTDLRYQPGDFGTREADTFLKTVGLILEWIDGRL
jgi:hypothetical protein